MKILKGPFQISEHLIRSSNNRRLLLSKLNDYDIYLVEKDTPLVLYEALYNPMTWESTYGTLSIHLSKKGAERSIEVHKNQNGGMSIFESWKTKDIIVQP